MEDILQWGVNKFLHCSVFGLLLLCLSISFSFLRNLRGQFLFNCHADWAAKNSHKLPALHHALSACPPLMPRS